MRTLQLATLVAISSFVLNCAGDVGDIDRTQPGKLRKSALEGEYYFRQTIIDVPFTTGVTFIGEQSYIDRVSFEISENTLTAYRTYEKVTGSEIPSQLPGVEYQGAPIAAFNILKHFDVVREYNPETGEQSNILTENDFDRPWYDRDYMRVDWSQNLLANFDFLAGGSGGLGVISQSASYAVTDPNSPEALVFGVKNGNTWEDHRDPMVWGELERIDYFDMTLKLQVTPDVFPIYYDDGSYEEWPACWFYEYGPWDCASQTVKVRAAFMKVPESDYEPLYYPDNYIARDANDEAITVAWDGMQMRQCTPAERPTCDTVRVPMFDWFGYFRTERETYDRGYGVTEEGRRYLINRFNIWANTRDSGGNLIPEQFRRTKTITYFLSENFPTDLIASAQEVGQWWNDAFVQTATSLGVQNPGVMFEVVPNDYSVQDGEVVNFGQRNGDLRYSHLYWVADPQFESLLGYGPSGADPLTGEIVVADAYVYGAAVDTYGHYGADVVDLMRGDILESEFIDGENVGSAVAGLGRGPSQSREQATQRARDLVSRGLGDRLRAVRENGPNHYRRQGDWVGSRLRLADDDPRFDALWSSEMRMAFEERFGRRLKPSEFMGGRLARAVARHRRELGKHGIDMRSFEDGAVLGLVQRLQGRTRDVVIQTIRQEIFKSVAAHEIGHTVGLRHNFAASADALNYFDEYWSIRDPGAQALDLPSRSELEAGLREYAYSSIMEYGAKFVSDLKGIGKYDKAAVKFGYGQLVEGFVSVPDWTIHDPLFYTSLDDAVGNLVHYTRLPSLFETSIGAGDGTLNMAARRDIPMSDVVAWMTYAPGAPDLTDTLVPYKFCSDEYDGADWDCATFDEGGDPYEIVMNAAQSYRDYYIFDAFKRHRRYVDPMEYYFDVYFRTMLPMATQYQQWIWNQWYAEGEWDWYATQDMANGTTVTQDPNWNLDPNGGLTSTAASMAAMNFLAEVISTPEPGSYFIDPDDATNLLWWTYGEDRICGAMEDPIMDNCSNLHVPIGNGRYAYSEFDGQSGYYWYERVRVVGAFWDKLAAIETLADPSTYFLGVDDVANFSQFILGFNEAFPHAVETLFGSIVNDDYRKFAVELAGNGNMNHQQVFLDYNAAYGDMPSPDRTGPFVDPATNFTVSIYALFYGMAMLNANFDQSFNDNAKIWLEGSGEAFTPDPMTNPADITTFTNPYNGRVYTALRSPEALDYSMGFEMVARAEALAHDPGGVVATNCLYRDAPECWGPQAELENLISNIELVRGYYDIFGYSWW